MIDLPVKLFNELVSSIAADLKAEGYVVHDDFDADQLRIYRLDPPSSEPRATMIPLVRDRAVVYLDAFATAEPRFGRRAALEAADALRAEEPGTARWLRMLFEYIRDELPEIDDDAAAELRAALKHRADRPASYYAAYRAARKDAALTRARSVIAKWLPLHVTPGKHAVGELWDQWQAQVLPAAATQAPELADLGRNGFYAALADVAEVHSGAGGTRYVVVTNATPE